MTIDANEPLIVYTCITGEYDNLRAPAFISSDIRYLCFTDGSIDIESPWVAMDIGEVGLSAKDKNRYVKLHPHKILPRHAASLYIDGSITIVGDIWPLVNAALAAAGDIHLYDHPERNCVYDEAKACAYFGHDWAWNFRPQMIRYRRSGFPPGNGLFEAGVMLRKNTPLMEQLMEEWWLEYVIGVKRDQLSLPFVAWKSGINLGSLGRSDPRFRQLIFQFTPHPGRTPPATFFRQRVNRFLMKAFDDRILGI